MKQPKRNKAQREINKKHSVQRVGVEPVRSEKEEVGEIGRETSDNESGHFKTCSFKRPCSGGVRERKGHCLKYLAPQGSERLLPTFISAR
jgi:hypothetical protein